MIPLQKHINKVNRSIKSLEEQIKKTTEKIEQLKTKYLQKEENQRKQTKNE